MTLVLSRPVLRALLAVISVTLLGTLWSVISGEPTIRLLCGLVCASLHASYLTTGTYLDTSNPLIANLPHPKHSTSYFANKRNVFNTVFVKRAWGWTSLVILANTFTTRRRLPVRLWRWGLATFVWLSFVAWFFGPSLRARLAAFSGAECIVQLPVSAENNTIQLVTIPAEYCIKMTRLSAKDHAGLIQDALTGNTGAGAGASAASVTLPEDWMGVPKLTRGHDVSGHVFLMSLSILAIVDNLVLGALAC